jgi:hypothetical protein
MTILQQISAFVLASALAVLGFKLLVKLRILPLLLWWGLGKNLYPVWAAGHSLLFYGVLAALALLTLASWLCPVLTEHLENKRLERMILEDLSKARAEGREIDSIQIQHGIPVAKYRA